MLCVSTFFINFVSTKHEKGVNTILDGYKKQDNYERF